MWGMMRPAALVIAGAFDPKMDYFPDEVTPRELQWRFRRSRLHAGRGSDATRA